MSTDDGRQRDAACSRLLALNPQDVCRCLHLPRGRICPQGANTTARCPTSTGRSSLRAGCLPSATRNLAAFRPFVVRTDPMRQIAAVRPRGCVLPTLQQSRPSADANAELHLSLGRGFLNLAYTDRQPERAPSHENMPLPPPPGRWASGLSRARVADAEVVKAVEGIARNHAGTEHRHVAYHFFRR